MSTIRRILIAVADPGARRQAALTKGVELARRLGNPHAMRAVGAANGANPIAIIVPCHRVIGHDGQLVGFGGGLPAKRWLLDHERHHAPAPLLELRP